MGVNDGDDEYNVEVKYIYYHREELNWFISYQNIKPGKMRLNHKSVDGGNHYYGSNEKSKTSRLERKVNIQRDRWTLFIPIRVNAKRSMSLKLKILW